MRKLVYQYLNNLLLCIGFEKYIRVWEKKSLQRRCIDIQCMNKIIILIQTHKFKAVNLEFFFQFSRILINCPSFHQGDFHPVSRLGRNDLHQLPDR